MAMEFALEIFRSYIGINDSYTEVAHGSVGVFYLSKFEEFMNYVWVFIGGGLGACARYWLSGFVYRFVEPDFPYGVLAVNVLGCLVIGFLMTGFEERFMINPSLRIFLTIGLLG